MKYVCAKTVKLPRHNASYAEDLTWGWWTTNPPVPACGVVQCWQMFLYPSLPPSFVIFLNTQQLEGKEACWVGTDRHAGAECVICNGDSRPTWSAAQRRELEAELTLITWMCLGAQLEAARPHAVLIYMPVLLLAVVSVSWHTCPLSQTNLARF